MSTAIRRLLALAGSGFLAFVVIVTGLAAKFWLLDLATFAWQYVVLAGIALTLTSFLMKSRLAIAVSLIGLLISLYPYLTTHTAQKADRCELRVVTANLFIEITSPPDRFLDFVREEQPDILVLQETPDAWQDPIRGLAMFGYESTRDLMAYDRVKVFSKLPIKSEGPVTDPSIGTEFHKRPIRLELGGWDRPLVLYAIHPETPRSIDQWRERNMHLSTMAKSASGDGVSSDVIVAGDWNTPSTSPFFNEALAAGGLADAGSGNPFITSRFSLKLYPYVFLGSTIDHVAVSGSLGVSNRRTGPMYGSNHLPVVVDIGRAKGSSNSSTSRPACGQQPRTGA
ncbi:endonuclease/exonuclease/phosphatase family protein [Rhizobium sp. BG4]|uniref:endonuclease/exonuclease/phosphatase family protein n=1 Tax=Rhizobium sp. BG4 TaxID=2613770 RepID=UPI00193EAF01|nr:endonuclease/exonuclease/phosphatase family protein [Rhizobium sp. BG4]QRM44637.1 endonuclease/exonuclease/phosphatase family protein [Rhizobium sp. BG4]